MLSQASMWDFNGHQLQKTGGQTQILVAKVKKMLAKDTR